MKLRITEIKIENDLVVISKFTIFDGETIIRDAAINEKLLKMLASIEIDLVKYSDAQKLFAKNPDLKILVERFNLELL